MSQNQTRIGDQYQSVSAVQGFPTTYYPIDLEPNDVNHESTFTRPLEFNLKIFRILLRSFSYKIQDNSFLYEQTVQKKNCTQISFELNNILYIFLGKLYRKKLK